MGIRGLAVSAALAVGACATEPPTPAAVYLDPAVRATQEQACARAFGQAAGVGGDLVRVRRASSDPENRSIVNASAGAVTGYCRVTAAGEVVEVVL